MRLTFIILKSGGANMGANWGSSQNTGAMQKSGMYANAFGGMLSAYNQYQQGKAEQEMYNFQADQILQQGVQQAAEVKKQGRQFLASQQAAMAANGMALDSLTAEDISKDTLTQNSLDEILIKYNAYNNAFQARKAGINSRIAGSTKAATTLMGTATQTMDSWNQWKKTSQGK